MPHGVVYQYGCQLSPHSEKSLVLFLEIKLNFLTTSREHERRIYMPVLYSGPYHAKKRSLAALQFLFSGNCRGFHLYHYTGRAGRGGATS